MQDDIKQAFGNIIQVLIDTGCILDALEDISLVGRKLGLTDEEINKLMGEGVEEE